MTHVHWDGFFFSAFRLQKMDILGLVSFYTLELSFFFLCYQGEIGGIEEHRYLRHSFGLDSSLTAMSWVAVAFGFVQFNENTLARRAFQVSHGRPVFLSRQLVVILQNTPYRLIGSTERPEVFLSFPFLFFFLFFFSSLQLLD